MQFPLPCKNFDTTQTTFEIVTNRGSRNNSPAALQTNLMKSEGIYFEIHLQAALS